MSARRPKKNVFRYDPAKVQVSFGGVPLTGFDADDLASKTETITEKFAVMQVGDRIVRTLSHSEYIALIYNRLEPYGA